jgi:hypothetical protein
VANPSESEKNNFLVQLATGDESQPRAALLRRFRKSRLKSSPEAARPRTVAELLAAAERRSDERHRKEGARGACEKVRREREEATARERYLDDLAKREPVTWQRIGSLIATKKPADYDEAVRLLRDLTDLGGRSGRAAEVQSRIQRIRDEHAKRPSLLRRLQRAGLIATATR